MRLLYFSPVPAESYAQRPHFMVRAWLDWGIESVLWVNPYPCRLPRLEDLRGRRRTNSQASPLDPRIHVLNVPALPIEPLPMGASINRRLFGAAAWRQIERFARCGLDARRRQKTAAAKNGPPPTAGNDELLIGIGRPCALALAALQYLNPAASFFDAMDNFPEFYTGLSRRSMQRCEDALATQVDLVVASSTFLAEKFLRRDCRVEKILNAFQPNDEPADQVSPPPSNGRLPPVLGYVGCIGPWFDWPLVFAIAMARPDVRIELVGPCVVPPPSRPPINVWLLPACPQSRAGNYLARFSAGLIPFRENALTAGVDPIKYYDYRAAGLPVLTTRFGEMEGRGPDDSVYFIDQNNDLSRAIAAALAHRDDDARIALFRRDNNWTSRFSRSESLRSLFLASRTRRAA